jgi:Fe(3+) dicitrate transport protein
LYVSSQFTEASNSKIDTNDNTYGIFEKSPYYVADFQPRTNGKLELEAV